MDGESIGWVSLLESESMEEEAAKQAESLKRKAAKQGNLDAVQLRPYDELSAEEQQLVLLLPPASLVL